MNCNIARVAALAVTVSILNCSWPQLQAQGYWLRTGNVEALYGDKPTSGKVLQWTTPSGWNLTVELSDSSITETAKLGKVTIASQVTWGARPLVIMPGEVIPVGGEAKAITTDGPGDPEVRAQLLCQLMRKVKVLDEKKKEVEKWGYVQELFPKTNFVLALGKAGISDAHENTTIAYGDKGKSYKGSPNIGISYIATSSRGDNYRVTYEYAWQDGPVPEATLKKMKEELEAVRKAKEKAGGKLKDKVGEPKVAPGPNTGKMSLIDVSGTWTIYSLGEVGTADEKKVHYTGSLSLTEDAKGGYTGTINFGSSEKLSDVSLKEGVLHFTRPLTDVSQKYIGKAAGVDKIEGTFTHNKKTFAWRAEKAAAKKGK